MVRIASPAWFWDDFDEIEHGFIPDTDAKNAERAYRLVVSDIHTIDQSEWGLLAPSTYRLFVWLGELAMYLG